MHFTMLGLIFGLIGGLLVTVIVTIVWPQGKARLLRPIVPALLGALVTVAAMYFIK
jgi:uncharacterized membrane protein YeaQ/YmgE (transglycosylase-associated protein family)